MGLIGLLGKVIRKDWFEVCDRTAFKPIRSCKVYLCMKTHILILGKLDAWSGSSRILRIKLLMGRIVMSYTILSNLAKLSICKSIWSSSGIRQWG